MDEQTVYRKIRNALQCFGHGKRTYDSAITGVDRKDLCVQRVDCWPRNSLIARARLSPPSLWSKWSNVGSSCFDWGNSPVPSEAIFTNLQIRRRHSGLVGKDLHRRGAESDPVVVGEQNVRPTGSRQDAVRRAALALNGPTDAEQRGQRLLRFRRGPVLGWDLSSGGNEGNVHRARHGFAML